MKLVMRPFQPENPGELDDLIDSQCNAFYNRSTEQSIMDAIMIGQNDAVTRARGKVFFIQELSDDPTVCWRIVLDMDAYPAEEVMSKNPGCGKGRIVSGMQMHIYTNSIKGLYEAASPDPLHLKLLDDGQAKYEAARAVIRDVWPRVANIRKGYTGISTDDTNDKTSDDSTGTHSKDNAHGYESKNDDKDKEAKSDTGTTTHLDRVGEPHILLTLLATLKEYRRCGAGSALIKWVTEVADSLNLPVWVQASSEGMPLYKKFGFEDIAPLDYEKFGYGMHQMLMRRPAKLSRLDEEVSLE